MKISMQEIFRLLSLFILSIFITFIIWINPYFLSENSLIKGVLIYRASIMRYSLCSCIILSFIIWCILYINIRYLGKRYDFIKILGAVLFAIIQTVSIDFYYFHSFIYITNQLNIIFYNFLCIISYGILFYCIENCFFFILEKISSSNRVGYSGLWGKHIGLTSFTIIFLCWVPWLAAFYPGSMWFDMCYQLEQYYFGNYHLHPIFVTLCMGTCLDIGKHLFRSDNVGVFIYILLQASVCAFSFSRVIKLFKIFKIPDFISYITLAYYSLSPIFGAYIQTGTKDVLNCGLFTLFTVYTVNIYSKLQSTNFFISFKEIVSLFITATLCSLYRKEMIILCLIEFLVLMLICIKGKMLPLLKGIIRATAGMLIIYILFDLFIVKSLLNANFNSGSTEALSIPLQHIARFVYYESDLIDEEEKDVLNQCFYYGYDEIANHYNPYLSDGIKYNFRKSEHFWETYISLFLKKPLVYIEATIANSFGYYSIIPPLPASINGAPTNGTPGSRFAFYINRDPDIDNQIVVIDYNSYFETVRTKLSAYANNVRNVPIINLLYSLGSYTWGGIILIFYIVKCEKNHKIRNLIAFLPFILNICVCIASPVNDCLRYFLPATAILPIMFGWTIREHVNNQVS